MSLAPGQQPASREVVIVAEQPAAPGATAQAAAPAAPSGPPHDVVGAARALGFVVKPLFPDASVHAPMIAASPLAAQNPELAAIELDQSRFYVTHVETDAQAQQAVDQLKSLPGVSTAYKKPAVESPLAPPCAKPTVPAAIPDYSAQQGYLDAAPGGVGARSFAGPAGRQGSHVRFIDIEGGWTLDHLELRGGAGGGLIGGQAFSDSGWTNHGTAVLGVVRAADNGFGVTGIAPEASFNAISHQSIGSAGAIDLGASSLGAGDILLLEMHRPGPRFGFQSRDDQQGYIAVEWWPDDFLAIRRAVLRGVIVVEAAGNGAQDLDDPFYDTPDPSFPETWKNPFRGARDTGAIVVGAGAPPGGLFGPDRSRLDFSNFGSKLDCQGWGRGVVTTGYGDLYGGADRLSFRTVAYTAVFSGTSSASPIVTGVVACLQGVARQRGGQLDPARARDLLRRRQSANGGPCRRDRAADRRPTGPRGADRRYHPFGIGGARARSHRRRTRSAADPGLVGDARR